MKKTLLIILLALISTKIVYSQDWKIKVEAVDTSRFPIISIPFNCYKDDISIIKDLNPAQISLYEGKREISKYKLIYGKTKKPIKLLILLDISSSMRGNKLLTAQKSIKELLDILNNNVEVALLTFGNNSHVISGFSKSYLKVRKQVSRNFVLEKKTHLFDALNDATSLFSSLDKSKNIIFLITDGKDDGSFIDVGKSIEKCNLKHVSVYAIGIGQNCDETTLGKIAVLTGGDIFTNLSMKTLRKALSNVYSLISAHYSILYHTPDSLETVNSLNRKVNLSVRYNGIVKNAEINFQVPLIKERTDYSWVNYIVFGFVVFAIVLLIVVLINNRKGKESSVSPILINDSEEKYDSEEESLNLEWDEDNIENVHDDLTIDDYLEQNIKDGKTVVISKKRGKTEALGYLVMKSPVYGQSIYEVHDNEILIGRSPQSDIFLEDEEVSKLHTKVRVVDGIFFVDDLGSSNGTIVNGEKVFHAELDDGDTISVGKHNFVFKCIKQT